MPSTGPTDESAPAGAELDDQLTPALASVVVGARRRASRDGDCLIDTAHLLHTLLESDPDVRTALGGGPPQVVRLLGYLVQRSIGYGLRWQGAVEDSGAVPVIRDTGVPGWSPAGAAALDTALVRARTRGRTRAEGLDLLAALAADPECRAVEVLRRGGVDPELLRARLDCEGSREPDRHQPGRYEPDQRRPDQCRPGQYESGQYESGQGEPSQCEPGPYRSGRRQSGQQRPDQQRPSQQ
ncbi:Clp protease N-terminal domain-containing protein [Streptomyces sp. H27-D2]|nr:Clp protease N-terminal domain-containing protein [Streptomyces sp. H27-D2]MEC4019855.1 Clp protease N-terminal domain-containing protein [Streptomyces sp. H27-D2]